MAVKLAESETFLTSVQKSAAKSNIVVITDFARQSDMKSIGVKTALLSADMRRILRS